MSRSSLPPALASRWTAANRFARQETRRWQPRQRPQMHATLPFLLVKGRHHATSSRTCVTVVIAAMRRNLTSHATPTRGRLPAPCHDRVVGCRRHVAELTVIWSRSYAAGPASPSGRRSAWQPGPGGSDCLSTSFAAGPGVEATAAAQAGAFGQRQSYRTLVVPDRVSRENSAFGTETACDICLRANRPRHQPRQAAGLEPTNPAPNPPPPQIWAPSRGQSYATVNITGIFRSIGLKIVGLARIPVRHEQAGPLSRKRRRVSGAWHRDLRRRSPCSRVSIRSLSDCAIVRPTQ